MLRTQVASGRREKKVSKQDEIPEDEDEKRAK